MEESHVMLANHLSTRERKLGQKVGSTHVDPVHHTDGGNVQTASKRRRLNAMLDRLASNIRLSASPSSTSASPPPASASASSSPAPPLEPGSSPILSTIVSVPKPTPLASTTITQSTTALLRSLRRQSSASSPLSSASSEYTVASDQVSSERQVDHSIDVREGRSMPPTRNTSFELEIQVKANKIVEKAESEDDEIIIDDDSASESDDSVTALTPPEEEGMSSPTTTPAGPEVTEAHVLSPLRSARSEDKFSTGCKTNGGGVASASGQRTSSAVVRGGGIRLTDANHGQGLVRLRSDLKVSSETVPKAVDIATSAMPSTGGLLTASLTASASPRPTVNSITSSAASAFPGLLTAVPPGLPTALPSVIATQAFSPLQQLPMVSLPPTASPLSIVVPDSRVPLHHPSIIGYASPVLIDSVGNFLATTLPTHTTPATTAVATTNAVVNPPLMGQIPPGLQLLPTVSHATALPTAQSAVGGLVPTTLASSTAIDYETFLKTQLLGKIYLQQYMANNLAIQPQPSLLPTATTTATATPTLPPTSATNGEELLSQSEVSPQPLDLSFGRSQDNRLDDREKLAKNGQRSNGDEKVPAQSEDASKHIAASQSATTVAPAITTTTTNFNTGLSSNKPLVPAKIGSEPINSSTAATAGDNNVGKRPAGGPPVKRRGGRANYRQLTTGRAILASPEKKLGPFEIPPPSHDPNESYGCPVCGQNFSVHDRLAKHLASRHKMAMAATSTSSASSSTSSSTGRRSSASAAGSASSAADLDSGESGAGGAGKAYFCDVCKRSFARSDMLTRHMRLHTGIKPYTCGVCHQVFSRSDHLSTHQRTHTGEKPYRCPVCPYSACRRDMITRHMRTHSRFEDENGGSELNEDDITNSITKIKSQSEVKNKISSKKKKS